MTYVFCDSGVRELVNTVGLESFVVFDVLALHKWHMRFYQRFFALQLKIYLCAKKNLSIAFISQINRFGSLQMLDKNRANSEQLNGCLFNA